MTFAQGDFAAVQLMLYPVQHRLGSHARPSSKRQRAFTLVELLVVIAIIAILVIGVLPALNAARELERRTQCFHRAGRLGLALQQYEMSHNVFPAGVIDPNGPIRSRPEGLHQGWIGQVLPFLDRIPLGDKLDVTLSVYDAANAAVRNHPLTAVLCPSAESSSADIPPSNFAGNHHDVEAPIDADNHGVLFRNSRIGVYEITDGLEFTLLLGEKLTDPDDLGWLSGTRATLRNTGTLLNQTTKPQVPSIDEAPSVSSGPDTAEAIAAPPVSAAPLFVGGFESSHRGGANMGFADGSVRFINVDIDAQVWTALGHRSDGSVPDETAVE